MVEIAFSVAAKLAEYLVAPVGRQFSYIWNYKTNFQNLETAVEKLKIKQKEVEREVEAAIRKSEEIEQHVIGWLDSVKEKVDEVSSEIIQEKEEQANLKCFKGFCPNPKKLYQHSRNAVRKAKSIVELQQQGNFKNVSHRTIPKEIAIPSEAFESRKSTTEKILNALSKPDVNILGIYGLGGIGKTTLARAVAEHAKNNKLFDTVAFVEVSVAPDIGKIQVLTAEMVGLEFCESTVPTRACRLREYLEQEGQKRKILLVFDNIWATLELHKVGIPLDEAQIPKGCKVLLTARDLNALKSTGSQLDFSMDVLNVPEAWNLFSTTAGECVEQSDLQDLAKQVANACGGLPIAIVTIAKALRNKNECEWSNALRELKKPSPRTLEGEAREAYSCIEFSYNHLKRKELKSIFLLCSTMGSTYGASIGDLVNYGMGLRIFDGIDKMKDARDLVDTLVRKLKDASLLLDTPNNGHFSMHDIVRDVGRLIASGNKHVVKMMDDNIRRDWFDDDTLKNSTRIFLHKIRELPKVLECQHLEFLYMQTEDDTFKIPDNFFTKMLNLRVLHLVGFNLLSLPSSLRLLVNLQTLYMDDCNIENIALKKLEILSIGKSMWSLHEEVCKFTGLRVLDLSRCHWLEEIPPNTIARLTQLEELYLGEVQGGSNAILDELKCLPHLTVLEIQIPNTNVLSKGLFCKNLERYNISIGQSSDNNHLYEKWPQTSRRLELNLGDNCSCLEDVLHKTPSVKNVLSALDGGEGFPKLKQLRVHSSSCFRTVADCSESESNGPFPSLETLFLEGLNNLEKIYNGQFGAEFLCQLRNIKVAKCDKLNNIFSLSTIRALPLEEIEVRDCENITEIFAIGKEEDIIHLKKLRSITLEDLSQLTSFCSINNNEVILEGIPTVIFNGKVVFPSLETIEISDMNGLEMIWQNQVVEDSFRSLKFVKVFECNKLLTIFKFNMLERCTRLESLLVHRCNSLKEIFDLQEVNLEMWSHSTVSSQLRELYLEDLQQMRHIWNKDPQRKLSFQKLNRVRIENCCSLENIFPASIGRNLSQLEQLHIYRCGEMEKIIAEEEGADLEVVTRFDFPRLTSLEFRRLSQLRYFYPGRHTAEWPELNKLSICYCLELGLLASEENNEGQLNILVQQPLFYVEKGCFLRKLEELRLTGNSLGLILQAQFSEHLIPKLKCLEVYDGESVFPPDILWRFPNLEKLRFNFGSYEEIFLLEEVEKHTERPAHAQIKSLQLYGIEKMNRIWKQHSKFDLIIQKLEILFVRKCGLTDLLPPSAFFQNLKILHVEYCHKLTSILTSSTAESLVQLTEMKLRSCDKLTEVVARDEGDVTKNKIIFHKLKTLILDSLSSLTNFCVENYTFEFPALEKLEVFDCTKMEIFCPGNSESSEEDGAGPSTQHQVLHNTESSEEDIWLWSFPATSGVTEYPEFEEDGSSPSTKHLVLQNAESYEEDGAGPSTEHLEMPRVLKKMAGPSLPRNIRCYRIPRVLKKMALVLPCKQHLVLQNA
ncbi:hypothetical protein EZV62_007380 [Acer yangbiense]|uniref:Uncharacterized protein n=1 Tax=Acer yangbiense TaxID=1000413 RepID=A0A5C7IA50_9ROSI|nr:hypothetical protein EZV62_007380 [Acer yangbiense]